MSDVDVELSPDFEKYAIAAALGGLRRLRDAIEIDMHRHLAPHDKTGELDRSIFCHLNEETGVIVGGANAGYAAYVEYGHHDDDTGERIGPFPFVRPSFLKKRGVV
jgi:hypothetical protein